MKPKEDAQQVFISTAAIFGIGLFWINFSEKVFKTIRHLISAPFTWHDRKKKSQSKFHLKKTKTFIYTMSDTKLVKTIMDAATLTGLAAGIGWVAKTMVKETLDC